MNGHAHLDLICGGGDQSAVNGHARLDLNRGGGDRSAVNGHDLIIGRSSTRSARSSSTSAASGFIRTAAGNRIVRQYQGRA